MSKRHLAMAGIALASAVVLSGCSAWNPNYQGTGDEFVIVATLDRVFKDDSVFVTDVVVEQASGKATNWFTTEAGFWSGDQDHAEVHDNYHDGDFWTTKVEVGHVFDANHQSRRLEGLPAGQKARLTGKIRSDNEGEEWTSRAVFDKLEILPQTTP